ncbi:hypothetical protein C4D60_Mb09t20920 [Musa balbisiana]|uniref:Uncharacterized protein n=1 Tax=Musa balbisiana TaxID=52838 RepID=A0A4V4H3E5_MUSBA|nr:hypothetical protein C4D60_Mb09t20920 [Musa balbisiana]
MTQPRIVPEPGDFGDGDNNLAVRTDPLADWHANRSLSGGISLATTRRGEARKKRAFEEERSIKKEGEASRKSTTKSLMCRHQRLDEPKPIEPRHELVFHTLSQSRFDVALPRQS